MKPLDSHPARLAASTATLFCAAALALVPTTGAATAASPHPPAALATASMQPAAGSADAVLVETAKAAHPGAPVFGTVAWAMVKDKAGHPAISGIATIPGRDLTLSILIRPNADPALPATQLVEVNFTPGANFSGRSVAALPALSVQQQPLGRARALTAASARVVVNSFIVALSSEPTDAGNNLHLLESNAWMNIAMVYADGTKASLSLHEDPAARQLFRTLLGA